MQYLAEVQKIQGFVSSKSAIKLLARNTNDAWQPTPPEQSITLEPNVVKDYKDGQLVLAEVSSSNQVYSVQDATRKIVSSLQSLSRAQDRFKVAEDEIEQWKQNLQFQAQELHRREQELEQREIELENIETIREEVDRAQQELALRQAEFEQMRQEIEARGKGLAADQLDELLQICDRLLSVSGDAPTAQLALEIIYDRQSILNQMWQELEQGRGQLQQAESQIQEFTQQLQSRRQQWMEAHSILIDMKTEITVQERLLGVQGQQLQLLKSQASTQESIYQNLAIIVESMGGRAPTDLLTPEEVQRLENMTIEELSAEIQRLQGSFDKDYSFLALQEEELADIEGQIADLSNRIDLEKDFAKRVEMEAELSSLQEDYDFQEESISGQRQTNARRQSVLTQQRAILDRRQNPASSSDMLDSLMSMLGQVEDQKRRLNQEVLELERQVSATRTHLHRQQEELRQQQQQHNQIEASLSHDDQDLIVRNRSLGEAISRVTVQEAILRPVQDIVDQVRPLLEQMANSESDPQQLVNNLRQVLQSLSA